MNSPSSSDTMFHPMRMWRLSDSDLYCVAMNTRRSPELMQLLRTKSMIRYGPPKYTAGFARSLVSGNKRSPAPPASTMTRLSSNNADIEVSGSPEYHTSRGSVAADHGEREAEHLVAPGFDVAQVQPFDDDRPAVHQGVMGGMAGLLVFLDREVVDAQHLDAVRHEMPRRRLGDPDKVVVKDRIAPQPRVG